MQPRVSIVMAARNAANYIGEALSSIEPALGHSDIPHEVLLADGQSTDRTLAIATSFPGVRLVSHRDGGIYDGMNRAVAAAQGEFIIILNSDDLLLPGGLVKLVGALSLHEGAGAASGGIKFGRNAEPAAALEKLVPLSSSGLLFGVPAINARLFRRSFLNRLGPFRTDLGLGADRELLLRALRTGMQGVAVEGAVYFYRTHAGSHTLSSDLAGRVRIYESDLQLASALLADPSLSPEERRDARAYLAIARVKIRRLPQSNRCARRQDTVERTRTLDLIRGLRHYFRWRGVLSGF